jgi:hypothetical protein
MGKDYNILEAFTASQLNIEDVKPEDSNNRQSVIFHATYSSATPM